ncbi:MAG: hypothetical protein AABZ57_04130, partial [Candidatus Margulisiibacteriota bacterium]
MRIIEPLGRHSEARLSAQAYRFTSHFVLPEVDGYTYRAFYPNRTMVELCRSNPKNALKRICMERKDLDGIVLREGEERTDENLLSAAFFRESNGIYVRNRFEPLNIARTVSSSWDGVSDESEIASKI